MSEKNVSYSRRDDTKRGFESNVPSIYRNFCIDAAKELRYGKKVIEKLKAAQTTEEMGRIMTTARKKTFGD